MTQRYKAIATLIWQFECEEDYEACLEKAREQLDQIVSKVPEGAEFDDFCMQLDLAAMKPKKKMKHVQEYQLEEVFSLITQEEKRVEFKVSGQSYFVKMNSDRYYLFKNNPNCVSCGLAGSRIFLDINPGDNSPHFNLYGEEHGRLVLMTKDHIMPKSKGGEDILSNYQTMCSVCNNLKGNYDLTFNEINELRELLKNKDKLPRKDLRELINKRREELSKPMTIIMEVL